MASDVSLEHNEMSHATKFKLLYGFGVSDNTAFIKRKRVRLISTTRKFLIITVRE